LKEIIVSYASSEEKAEVRRIEEKAEEELEEEEPSEADRDGTEAGEKRRATGDCKIWFIAVEIDM
jgi:hypothetical protein